MADVLKWLQEHPMILGALLLMIAADLAFLLFVAFRRQQRRKLVSGPKSALTLFYEKGVTASKIEGEPEICSVIPLEIIVTREAVWVVGQGFKGAFAPVLGLEQKIPLPQITRVHREHHLRGQPLVVEFRTDSGTNGLRLFLKNPEKLLEVLTTHLGVDLKD
ncbi:MAG: hypothetical protein AB1813_09035 [Verrucomicrobiota bacterium]